MTGEVLHTSDAEVFAGIAEQYEVAEPALATQGLTSVMRRAAQEAGQQLDVIMSGASDVNGAVPAFQSVTQTPESL